MERRVGTAGWTLPKDVRTQFDAEGSQLERYARRFSCVEINSSFYRPHRRATYERWSGSVPRTFRFALKIPKTITHERRFADVDALLARFLDETSGLGSKRDVLLVQLPPSFEYDAAIAEGFFALMRSSYEGRVACEPRHASWFDAGADALLRVFDIARVAADPPAASASAEPGGSRSFTYRRLHGTPRIYYSAYDADAVVAIAASMRASSQPAWCVFDNTAAGAATANALALTDLLDADR
jgi:uncharacterized protein YecE (DUF72 family)